MKDLKTKRMKDLELRIKMHKLMETTERPEHKAMRDRWLTLAYERLSNKALFTYPTKLGMYWPVISPIIQKG